MIRIGRGLVVVGILLAVARGAEPNNLHEVVENLKAALKEGDYASVTNALTHAVEARWKAQDKKLGPLLRTVGVGIKHDEPTIASACIRALVEMRVPGSSRYLKPRLAVPKKVGSTYWDVHLAAIAAAGELHEPESVSPLFKLVEHPQADMAVAAAKALGRYEVVVPKQRKKLIQRIANALAKFEKAKPKGTLDRTRIERVTKALVECAQSLTGDHKLENSREVRVWLRTGGQPASTNNASDAK